MLGGLRRWAMVPAILLLALALALLGLIQLQQWTREELRRQHYDSLAFADIDCPAPPGGSKSEFLREVRYQSGMPAQLSLLEDGLAGRLADAFGQHPRVARVDRVEIAPPHEIQVKLTFRIPVLAVVVSSAGKSQSFLVDAHGVHLGPVGLARLPTYRIDAPSGAGKPPWDEPAIRAAAETAAYLQPRRDVLKLQSIEGRATCLRLHGAWPGEATWGRAPGQEARSEPPAGDKLQRLLHYARQKSDARPRSEPPLDLRERAK